MPLPVAISSPWGRSGPVQRNPPAGGEQVARVPLGVQGGLGSHQALALQGCRSRCGPRLFPFPALQGFPVITWRTYRAMACIWMYRADALCGLQGLVQNSMSSAAHSPVAKVHGLVAMSSQTGLAASRHVACECLQVQIRFRCTVSCQRDACSPCGTDCRQGRLFADS